MSGLRDFGFSSFGTLKFETISKHRYRYRRLDRMAHITSQNHTTNCGDQALDQTHALNALLESMVVIQSSDEMDG